MIYLFNDLLNFSSEILCQKAKSMFCNYCAGLSQTTDDISVAPLFPGLQNSSAVLFWQ